MTTITINPRTKAGKTLLEIASLLAVNNKGISINTGLNASVPAVKNQLLKDFKTANEQLKQSRLSKMKRKPLDDLIEKAYNPAFVNMIKKREANIKSGKSKLIRINPNDVWQNIL